MSNMQDVLNTYEGAKPSRLGHDPLRPNDDAVDRDDEIPSPRSYLASRIYDPGYDTTMSGEGVNGTESWHEGGGGAFCGPGTQRECFWVILASRSVIGVPSATPSTTTSTSQNF